jgi:hypothetical protein
MNFHNRSMSYLEAVLSRGDRRLSEVIFRAFNKGARFDAWSNYFSPLIWQGAFLTSGLDQNFYLREKPASVFLPWDFIDVGISREMLLEELNNSYRG